MMNRLTKEIELKLSPAEGLRHLQALGGCVDIFMHPNPRNIILHTALAGDINGFIYVATFGTSHEHGRPV